MMVIYLICLYQNLFRQAFLGVRLNKRESFKRVFDNFDICKVFLYTEEKINKLMNNKEL